MSKEDGEKELKVEEEDEEEEEEESIYQLSNGTHIAIRKCDKEIQDSPNISNTSSSSATEATHTAVTFEVETSFEEDEENIDQYMEIVVVKCRSCQFFCSSKAELLQHIKKVHNNKSVSRPSIDGATSTSDVATTVTKQTAIKTSTMTTTSSTTIMTSTPAATTTSQDQDLISSLLALAEKDVVALPKHSAAEVSPVIVKNQPSQTETHSPPRIFLCGHCSMVFSGQDQCKEHMVQGCFFRNQVITKNNFILLKQREFVNRTDDPNTSQIESIKSNNNNNSNGSRSNNQNFEVVSSKRKRKPSSKSCGNSENNDVKSANKTRKRCSRTGCSHRFNEEDLKLHLSCHEKDTDDRGFRCPHCDESFSKWRPCALHLWKFHRVDVDLLTCPICKVYKTLHTGNLDNHVKTHSTQKLYSCDKCGKSFKQVAQLKNHSVIHLDKDSDQIPSWYAKKQCELCDKYFSDSKCLKKHVQAVHSKLKPYICQVCNHQTSRKAMLDMHMRQHTGEKPYECDICSYRSGDHNSLRRHKMRHNGQRPYRCSICGYSSIQSSALKKHVQTKHRSNVIVDDDSMSCSICSFKCSNEDELVSHVNTHESSSSTSSVSNLIYHQDEEEETEVIIEVTNEDGDHDDNDHNGSQYMIVKENIDQSNLNIS